MYQPIYTLLGTWAVEVDIPLNCYRFVNFNVSLHRKACGKLEMINFDKFKSAKIFHLNYCIYYYSDLYNKIYFYNNSVLVKLTRDFCSNYPIIHKGIRVPTI